jgi:hypothetical protein
MCSRNGTTCREAHAFFKNEQFNFELQLALGGDADSWCTEWNATGERGGAIADKCAAQCLKPHLTSTVEILAAMADWSPQEQQAFAEFMNRFALRFVHGL